MGLYLGSREDEPTHGTTSAGLKWFNSRGFTDTSAPAPRVSNTSQLLVAMASSGEQEPPEQGVSSRMLWGKVKPFSLYSKAQMRPGFPVHFLSVLQAHQLSPEGVAQGIGVQPEGSHAGAFSVRVQGARVAIASDGSWAVARGG